MQRSGVRSLLRELDPHMLQLKSLHLAMRILHATTNTQCSQKKKRWVSLLMRDLFTDSFSSTFWVAFLDLLKRGSCPLSQWCHPTISSSIAPFSSCLQSFPASESFPMSQLFASDGQSIGASASVFPMNIQCWFPLGLTSLIFLEPKELSRVFSSTMTWKHQFFCTQPSLWSNSQFHTWLLEKP